MVILGEGTASKAEEACGSDLQPPIAIYNTHTKLDKGKKSFTGTGLSIDIANATRFLYCDRSSCGHHLSIARAVEFG